MRTFSSKSISVAKWSVLGLVAAAALVACGGGSSTPDKVAAANTTVAVNPTSGAAATAVVSGKTFTFTNGVAAFGTTAATTVQVTSGAGTAPATFEIKSGTGVATGDYSFGSCIFTIKVSTIPSVAVGSKITVDPCSYSVPTAGRTANGVAVDVNQSWFLGTSSAIIPVKMTLNPDGSVVLDGKTFGSVTLSNVTGG
jgi:hypothetical protein